MGRVTMKNRAVVSERGTITIPEPVRKKNHIHPGDILEFYPQGNRVVLKHLVVEPREEFLTQGEWDQLDKAVEQQLKKGEYTSYSRLDKAASHSRKLARKK